MQALENPIAMEYCQKMKEIESLQACIKKLHAEADELKPKVTSWLMETQTEQTIIFEDDLISPGPMRLAVITKPSAAHITKAQLESSTSKYVHSVLASVLSQDDRTLLIKGIRDVCWNERISKPVQKLVFNPIKKKENIEVLEVNEPAESLAQMSKKRKTTDLVQND